MKSWVYLFSKFTTEALLFEGLAITLLCAAYAAFWVLRKRRFGAVKNEVPVGVVKTYLNELIVDAEQLRAQLFGLLAANGVQMTERPMMASAVAGATVMVQDPEVLKKVALLESKMSEQLQAMTAISAEKTRLEKELAEARAKGGATGTGGNDADLSKLQEKVQSLENKLAEYSVIEDDLANLKRLQQENAQLKSALAAAGGAPVAAAAPAKTPAPAPTPVEAANDSPLDGGITDAAFEGLVDHVEQSLEPVVKSAEPAAPSTSAPQAATVPKSDEDLVAEFEKMLSS